MKWTIDQIRERFDNDVDRFANLETGQSATIDAPLVLELLTGAAAAATPHARALLDIGCGAGNFTLKLLQALAHLDVTLVDLSQRMLDRARDRVGPKTSGTVRILQADVRALDLGVEQFDIVIAAAVLHHLRTDAEWDAVFTKCHRALRPGGGFWIADLITHAVDPVQDLMWARYGAYLTELGGAEYRERVFQYTDAEDTPRSMLFQTDLLRQVGFDTVEILHKNSCFAAFGAIKNGAAVR
jgi:tRNA (cmo5U34)-methyltransferase